MTAERPAQGWYQDPFAIHELRYFSQDLPTKLVRDGKEESYDPPPDRPLPDGDLVPAIERPAVDGADLRRADEASTNPYDAAKARRAALDVFDLTAGTN
jgi:hypothetical protein